jgi:hypothetical protein
MALISILLLLVATAGHAADLPTGIWYHEGQPDDPNLVSVHELHADGTYRFEFRRYERCEIVYSNVEEGRWEREGDVITTIAESVHGYLVSYTNQYIVEAESETEMRIRHLENDHLYIERRLEQAEFPGCFWGT